MSDTLVSTATLQARELKKKKAPRQPNSVSYSYKFKGKTVSAHIKINLEYELDNLELMQTVCKELMKYNKKQNMDSETIVQELVVKFKLQKRTDYSFLSVKPPVITKREAQKSNQ